MKVYEVALEKIKESNILVNKSNKHIKWGILIMLIGYFSLSIFTNNILLLFNSTPEIVSKWERLMPLIWILISVLFFSFFFFSDTIQKSKFDHKNAYYFKYNSKEIYKFLSWKKEGYDVNIVKNHIKKIVNKHYSDKNKLVDELMVAINDNDIKSKLYHINDYKKFIKEFDIEN